MLQILIEAGDRARLENAMRDWADELPREPGQIGKTIISLVYGHQADGGFSVQIPREFVPYLAQMQFPFRVE
jgi:hypothetical protein